MEEEKVPTTQQILSTSEEKDDCLLRTNHGRLRGSLTMRYSTNDIGHFDRWAPTYKANKNHGERPRDRTNSQTDCRYLD